MPRRKQYLYPINASDSDFYQQAVNYLRKQSESDGFDLDTIEISVKKKVTPRIKNLDQAITNLSRYIANNKGYANYGDKNIRIFGEETVVLKKDIVKMLKITRPTFDKWIKDGFITPLKSKKIANIEVFPPDAILAQLIEQKNKK
ncbi:hypothetical protein FACS189435_0090 [Bacteroidia bacterium]|nr:hypothetical protein FACS189435_0090 [Bacteroidia bacterium]